MFEQCTTTHQIFPIKPNALYSHFWAGLDMHSIFCSLGSWGRVNEAPPGLFHVKSSSDSTDIVLFLYASPIVNKLAITQLGWHWTLTSGEHTHKYWAHLSFWFKYHQWIHQTNYTLFNTGLYFLDPHERFGCYCVWYNKYSHAAKCHVM